MSTTKKNTVTMKAGTAKYLADAMLAGSSKDNLTPVICAAKVTIKGGALTAIATDRYRVHMVHLDVEGKAKDHEFVIGRELLTWLSKNANAFRSRGNSVFNPTVTIETREPSGEQGDDGLCVITVCRDADLDTDVLTMTGTLVRGNFPHVYRLVDTARIAEANAADIVLNLDFMASVRALSPAQGINPKIRFTVASNPNKPGPIYLAWGNDRVIAEALIQPNLR